MTTFYVAVRRWNKVVGAPVGVPLLYPEKVVLLGSSQIPPDQSGDWEIMTDFQCAELKRSMKTEWQVYQQQVAAQKIVATRIKAAMDFGRNLMAEYGAQNVVSGKTTAQVTQIATKLSTLQALLLSGSLYAALDEIDLITSDALVTDQVKAEFKAKIRKYLGI
jgi:hypothetical protein